MYFCPKCNKTICQSCLGIHEHNISDIKKIREIINKNDKEKYDTLIGKLKKKRDSLLYFMKLLDTIIKTYEGDPNNYYNNINLEKRANDINEDKI